MHPSNFPGLFPKGLSWSTLSKLGHSPLVISYDKPLRHNLCILF